MKHITTMLGAFLFFISANAVAQSGGFNLTESGKFVYDANLSGGVGKTEAQNAVDQIKRLGGKHVELNVRATMITGKGTELIPVTPPADRSNETKRIVRLMKYIKDQGMTVGIRPIFFVVGPNGEFPYSEVQPDGTKKFWWHGNIQPTDPNRWFESFRTFLDMYITATNLGKADSFTIGAELYSMTVGIEDQWKDYPYGFPGRWLTLLRYLKQRIPNTKIMYDINFTDDAVNAGGISKSGGELERWRYRLVDLANPKDPAENAIWKDLINFWKELDAVGIDMYRSLASSKDTIPSDFAQLVGLLKQRTDSYASQLDTTATEISLVTEVEKLYFFKEVGYRSSEKGFIDPFTYSDGSGPAPTLNMNHQAAAYEAFFQSLWDAKWPWFGGVFFWDISVDPAKAGNADAGFSPIGKPETENSIKKRF